MGLHGGAWRVHTSALDDDGLILNALSWLCGKESQISLENEKSALGAPMKTVVCQMNGKRAKESLGYLPEEELQSLIEAGLESLIDEDKFLHLRISLSELVRGNVTIANSRESIVKGRFKLEVYPGQNAIQIVNDLFEELRECE